MIYRSFASLSLALAICTSAALGTDASGRWRGELILTQPHQEVRPFNLELRLDGAKVVGTIGDQGSKLTLLDGRVDHDEISFGVSSGLRQVPRFDFRGKIKADTIEFVVGGAGSEGKVHAKGHATAKRDPIPGWYLSGANRTGYGLAVDRETFHSGAASALIRRHEKRCSDFGTLMQTIRADEYAGLRIRFSAWVKAAQGGKPRLWMRVDGQDGQTLAFDNMDKRSKRGPFDWLRQEVVLDVSTHAALIHFGMILDGNGAAWLDDAKIETVGEGVPSTNLLKGPGSMTLDPARVRQLYFESKLQPINLDFQEQE